MKRVVWAVDLGGTKIAVACVDAAGRITHRLTAPTPREGGKTVVETIARILGKLPRTGVGAIGVAVPGLVRSGGSVWAPNIAGWNRMPLPLMLGRRFDLPVVVESDRNACVVGEAWKGAAQRARDVIFIAIGTGVGAGILSGGRLIRGRWELAGCVGWMSVRERFLPPYEFSGCLESHVAGPAIAAAARRVFRRAVSTEEVVRLARRGDPQARAVLARAGHNFGVALANLVSVLNPELIVVGGGFAAAGKFLLDPAREEMIRWAQPLATRQVRIVRSRLGASAALIGVARFALMKLEGTPTL
ncbi:MAG: ROK family protein [Terriglobia bacterium]